MIYYRIESIIISWIGITSVFCFLMIYYRIESFTLYPPALHISFYMMIYYRIERHMHSKYAVPAY